MTDIVAIFSEWHPFEWLAAILGVIGVWYVTRGNLWGYPIGGISVLLYCWICYQTRLYAHMGVNGYYFVLNAYGWWRWLVNKRSQGSVQFAYCTRQEYVWIGLAWAATFAILYYALMAFTDGQLIFWDAFTTAFYVISMFLMAHRRIESWIGWIIGDVLVIPLYYSLDLYFTTGQFVVFLFLAVKGYQNWHNMYQKQKNT